MSVDKIRHFLTPSPPHLVHVVIECPLTIKYLHLFCWCKLIIVVLVLPHRLFLKFGSIWIFYSDILWKKKLNFIYQFWECLKYFKKICTSSAGVTQHIIAVLVLPPRLFFKIRVNLELRKGICSFAPSLNLLITCPRIIKLLLILAPMKRKYIKLETWELLLSEFLPTML